MATRPDWVFNVNALDDAIERNLAPGITTRIIAGDQAMVSVVRFAPNSAGSVHRHDEEQWGILIEGSGTRMQNGVSVAVAEGDFWISPGEIEHGFVAGPDGAVVMDIFAPPREAYRKAGSGFASG